MKPRLVRLNTLQKLFESNSPKSPVFIRKKCSLCGCNVDIELHKTSGGFGLQGGILLEFGDRTMAQCLKCYEKLAIEIA